RAEVSVPRHARALPTGHQGLWSRALRVGQRFSLRTMVPERHLRTAPEDLHAGVGAGCEDPGGGPRNDGAGTVVFGEAQVGSDIASTYVCLKMDSMSCAPRRTRTTSIPSSRGR